MTMPLGSTKLHSNLHANQMYQSATQNWECNSLCMLKIQSGTENTPWFYTGKCWRRLIADSGTLLSLSLMILISTLEWEDHGYLLLRLGLSAGSVFSYINFKPSIYQYFLGSESLLQCFPESKVAADPDSFFHQIIPSIKTILISLGILMPAMPTLDFLNPRFSPSYRVNKSLLIKTYTSDPSDQNEVPVLTCPFLWLLKTYQFKEK